MKKNLNIISLIAIGASIGFYSGYLIDIKRSAAIGIVSSHCERLFPVLHYDRSKIKKLSHAFDVMEKENWDTAKARQSRLLLGDFFAQNDIYFTVSVFDLPKTQDILSECLLDTEKELVPVFEKYNTTHDKSITQDEKNLAIKNFLNYGLWLIPKKTLKQLLNTSPKNMKS
jgi:hypothetical protein